MRRILTVSVVLLILLGSASPLWADAAADVEKTVREAEMFFYTQLLKVYVLGLLGSLPYFLLLALVLYLVLKPVVAELKGINARLPRVGRPDAAVPEQINAVAQQVYQLQQTLETNARTEPMKRMGSERG